VLKFHYLQKTFLGGIMMDRIISFCGLICTDCEAYQATQVKDHDWLERVAAGWREEYKNPAFTAENVAYAAAVWRAGLPTAVSARITNLVQGSRISSNSCHPQSWCWMRFTPDCSERQLNP
jgi:hypothetical protein